MTSPCVTCGATDCAHLVRVLAPRYGERARTVRVPDDLWTAAKGKAAERGETVSDVLRRALERYVKR